MIRFVFLRIACFLVATSGFSQILTVHISSVPEDTPVDAQLYLAGNINSWNPGDPNYRFTKTGEGAYELEMFEAAGTMEYKITRGSWATVEGNENGQYLPNREFVFGTTDLLEIRVLSWENQGIISSTAAENVHVMAENFEMPQLNRTRKIWIYLPPDYENSDTSYAVMYMHDGQNLFDDSTSFAGEWNVDETFNTFYQEGIHVPIVIGIENGGIHRINEYSPWAHPEYGGGDGDLYANFIVETLKPYIDDTYRTIADREHTFVMGSSMGGLISLYIGLKHGDVFGKIGIFSPSYWFSDSSFILPTVHPPNNQVIYQMSGSEEGGTIVEDTYAMDALLAKQATGTFDMATYIHLGGTHNENLWSQQFGAAYLFMYDEISSMKETIENENIFSYDRAKAQLVFQNAQTYHDIEFVKVYDLSGRLVAGFEGAASSYSISHLPDGLYLVMCQIKGKSYSHKILK